MLEYLYTHNQLVIAAVIFLISDLSVYTTATLTNAINSKKKHRPKAAQIFHKATMSFIEKSVALPEIMTLSSTHSQYRMPVREEAWKAVM